MLQRPSGVSEMDADAAHRPLRDCGHDHRANLGGGWLPDPSPLIPPGLAGALQPERHPPDH